MATLEVTVDQKPVDLAPIDPNVVIPAHVRQAAERANSFYAKPPEAEAPAPEAAPEPIEAAPAPVEQPPPPPAPPQDYTAPASKEELQGNDWAGRYNSMRGRWEAAQRTIGSMQEQMSQMGDELMRAHQMLRGNPTPQAPTPTAASSKLITPEDEAAYGTELIDLAKRAALETVGPEIEQLRNENNSLKQKVVKSDQHKLRDELGRQIPNWTDINKSAEFKNWLRLPNIYTGMVRQQMLNDAYNAADAPKVVAFFKDFLREGVATGQMAPASQPEPAPPPRQAAMNLEQISAPGRARPASGEASPAPADKPVITRAQIQNFYNQVRSGYYAGRETEKARLEAMIFSAQGEGRVR